MKYETVIKQHKGWVINTRSKDGHGLLGKHYWLNGRSPVIAQHLDGYLSAVFRTRKAARFALNDAKRAFPDARVERVTITISKERHS